LEAATYARRSTPCIRQTFGAIFSHLGHDCGFGLLAVRPIRLALAQTRFTATPLTDFLPGQLYLGRFPGLLYTASNNPPPDHDADGRSFASRIVPIGGKIVVIGIGMSNWTIELCTGVSDPSPANCKSNSFFAAAAADPSVNHTSLALVDCAQGGHDARQWIDDSFGSYTVCDDRLAARGLTPDQVEVILWKNGDEHPTVSLSPSTVCSLTSPVDGCVYEKLTGEMARFAKSRYPRTLQLFVHSRIYGGFALTTLNPEPFAYEYGFATKWLVNAQIVQIRTGKIDPTAGDLSYSMAPWIAWGPYFWASGPVPRNDGLAWLATDYSQSDLTHPGPSGVTKVADQMMYWYLSSPYTPWFRASGM